MAPIIQNLQNDYQQRYRQQYGVQQNFAGVGNQEPNFAATPNQSAPADVIVQNNPLLSAATSAPEKPASFLGQAALAFAALFGINDFINNPLLTKNYNDTIFKKAENWGDKLAQKDTVKSIGKFLGSVKNKAVSLVNKSEILRTLFYKESLGGSNVMSQAAGTKGHLATRAIETMKAYKAKTGFAGFDAIIAKAEKDSYLYYDEIMQTIKTSKVNLKQVLSSKPWWGAGLVKNKKSLQEILNKDILIQNYKGAGKTLGQKISGYLMRGTECITNGVFSGKGQVLLQALFVAQSLNEASKAEKGEKFQTFMASFAELMAFMATMGIQQRVVNHLAGLKYIGFTPQHVNQYKEAIKLANEAAKNKDFAAHAANVLKASNLKKLAAENTKWFQKPIKWLGNIVSFGRIKETIKPLKSNAVTGILSKIPYGLKVGLGFVGRVALIMGVLVPIFSGIAKKTSYAIFGKPTKTIEREKQKELEEAQKAQQEAEAAEQSQAPQQPQPVVPMTQPQPQTFAQQPVQPAPRGNLYDKMVNMHNQQIQSQPIASQPIQNQPIANQPIASQPVAQNPADQSPEAGIKRSYIPNPILGQEKTAVISETRTAAIDKVMRQADFVESQAAKYL